ncbi:cytochrome-b5 reductase, partial [Phenoliferia sp. Uapishka_3]
MMQSILRPTLRAARASIPSARTYATAPAGGASNLAPIFLGLGLAGAGGFYYSTLGSAKKTDLAKQASAVVEKVEAKVGLTGLTALTSDAFQNFKLESIEKYNHNTSTFASFHSGENSRIMLIRGSRLQTFALPEGTTSGMTIASAVVVKSATEGQALNKNGKPAIKPYTPVSAPDVQGKLTFLIKHYPGGVMTEHIFGLKVGDELSIKGPIPKFPYKANEFETVAMIAGGSGITPMWQIIQQIDADPTDKTKAVLVFGNVTEADILLRKEFEELAARKPEQFKIHFVLDKPPTNWTGPTGYIDQKVLAQALPGPAYGDRIKLFICGPPGQVESISGNKVSMKDQGPLKGVLADLGYKESQVYKF